MKLIIETKRQAWIVVVSMSFIGGIGAVWLPVSWELYQKVRAGFFAGLFWGFMAFQSRLIGAFEPDPPPEKNNQTSE